MVVSWKLHHPTVHANAHKKARSLPVAPICPFTIFTPDMEVHFFEEQEWLSLCLREEEMHFLRAGIWERDTELIEVLFAAEEMIGKPSTWPPCLTKLWFKKHLDHWGMLKLFNFVLYNGSPLHAHFVSMAEGSRCSI